MDADISVFNLYRPPLGRPNLQAKVAASIADKDVGILVNNVGVSYPFPKYFDEVTDAEVRWADITCFDCSDVQGTQQGFPVVLPEDSRGTA